MLSPGAAWRSVGVLLLMVLPQTAQADPTPRRTTASLDESLIEARTFMGTMVEESRRDAARIRELYDGYQEPYADRAALVGALAAGRLVQLGAMAHFNIAPRLGGDSPIGELDMAFQPLYVSAHPAALGCLLHVASRVRSAAVDVTSLVRHVDYQHALRRKNANATPAFSTHTVGVAFDLSILHQSPSARREIRDVLRRMRNDGDLLFVAEQRQLVFHVVPHPDQLGFYEAIFRGITAAPIPRFTLSRSRDVSPARVAQPTPSHAATSTRRW